MPRVLETEGKAAPLHSVLFGWLHVHLDAGSGNRDKRSGCKWQTDKRSVGRKGNTMPYSSHRQLASLAARSRPSKSWWCSWSLSLAIHRYHVEWIIKSLAPGMKSMFLPNENEETENRSLASFSRPNISWTWLRCFSRAACAASKRSVLQQSMLAVGKFCNFFLSPSPSFASHRAFSLLRCSLTLIHIQNVG